MVGYVPEEKRLLKLHIAEKLTVDHVMSKMEKKSTNSGTVQEVEGNKCEDETDAAKPPKQEDLFCEASSLHEKMLMFSKELNTLIKRRKRTDDECRQTALEISVSP
ncbi:unnamed protein product [Haemonchus placei]|uniref:BEN domain-containing protein n=1 Tax=Haemonchus placei TaxID=6290 RepID=A0A0N4VUG6_HAEPC|nr:unnamed protein product [Haemonchus placei]